MELVSHLEKKTTQNSSKAHTQTVKERMPEQHLPAGGKVEVLLFLWIYWRFFKGLCASLGAHIVI